MPIRKLIESAAEQKPSEFFKGFEDLITTRAAELVAARKQQIAQSWLGVEEEEETDLEEAKKGYPTKIFKTSDDNTNAKMVDDVNNISTYKGDGDKKVKKLNLAGKIGKGAKSASSKG